MIEPKLLAILRCPVSGEKLEIADKTLLASLNSAIQQGRLRDRQDQPVGEPLEGGLVAPGVRRLYPVRNHIPVMIGDESIDLRQLDDA